MPEYRFVHFQRELTQEDAAFRPTPGPGDLLPRFDLPTTDDGRVRSEQFAGKRLLLTFGSVT